MPSNNAFWHCALAARSGFWEGLLREKYPAKRPLKSLGGQTPCVNFIRYADDFVITGRSKELLEEIKPLVEGFLRERGLELSPEKTVITHVTAGFDFLGQNVRRYPNGKLLIKPSRKNIQSFLDDIRETIRTALSPFQHWRFRLGC